MEEPRRRSSKKMIEHITFSTPRRSERFDEDRKYRPGNIMTLINKTPDAKQDFNNKSQYSY